MVYTLVDYILCCIFTHSIHVYSGESDSMTLCDSQKRHGYIVTIHHLNKPGLFC